MDDSEVDEMLQIGSDESGLGFSDAARQRIRTIANGSPYIATLLAHHAGMRAIDEEVLEISSAHVAAAIREALRELESRIRSEERRVGKECVRTCRSRWAPYH